MVRLEDESHGNNELLKKQYFEFDAKHSKEGAGIEYVLNGHKGKLYPDASFLPYHQYFFIPGVEPPEVEWKRKTLILAYYETRAMRASNKFNQMKHNYEEAIKRVRENPRGADSNSLPSGDRIADLRVEHGVAQKYIEELQRVREELGDVRDPIEIQRDRHADHMNERCSRISDELAELRL